MDKHRFYMGSLQEILNGGGKRKLSTKGLLCTPLYGKYEEQNYFVGVFEVQGGNGFFDLLSNGIQEDENLDKKEKPVVPKYSKESPFLTDNSWIEDYLSRYPEINYPLFNVVSRADNLPRNLISIIYNPLSNSYSEVLDFVKENDGLDRIEVKPFNSAPREPREFSPKGYFGMDEYERIKNSLSTSSLENSSLLKRFLGRINMKKCFFGLTREEAIFSIFLKNREIYESRFANEIF